MINPHVSNIGCKVDIVKEQSPACIPLQIRIRSQLQAPQKDKPPYQNFMKNCAALSLSQNILPLSGFVGVACVKLRKRQNGGWIQIP